MSPDDYLDCIGVQHHDTTMIDSVGVTDLICQ